MSLNLHLASGTRHIPGFVNVDIVQNNAVDVIHDLTKPFPFDSESCQFIYTEHFIEHISRQECLNFFKECYRVLIKGGVVRISTPDLDRIIADYLNPYYSRRAHWTKIAPWGKAVPTGCFLFNIAFTCWGHRYIYNFKDLSCLLGEVGFKKINQKDFGVSNFEIFKNIDYRDNSLILEAIK